MIGAEASAPNIATAAAETALNMRTAAVSFTARMPRTRSTKGPEASSLRITE